MAPLALIQIWRGGKLTLVSIRMAVRAAVKLDLERRLLSPGYVTLRALDRGMLALERITGERMILHRELRRLESLNTMAGRALTSVRPLQKLSVVSVGVAIRAFPIRQRMLEVSTSVAEYAVHLLMLTE